MIIVIYVDDLNLVKIHNNNNLIEKRMWNERFLWDKILSRTYS